MQLLGVGMLQYLAERPRKVAEVLLVECCLALVTEKVEGSQKGAVWQWAK
jgi:hypothetical protein